MTNNNNNNNNRIEPSDVKHEVDLLRKDVDTVKEHATRLDAILEQLKDLSDGISKMISIHEEKLKNQEREDQRLVAMIEDRDTKRSQDINQLDKKVDQHHEQLTQTLQNHFNQLSDKMDNISQNRDDNHSQLEERVRKVEKFVWMALGAGGLIGVLVSLAGVAVKAVL